MEEKHVRTRAYQHSLSGSTLPPGETLLQVSDLSLRFGGVKALTDVNLTVESGTIHSIIGPNGAGKSSLLNCVSGLYKATAGQIMLHRQGKQGRNAESRGSADLQAKDLSRLPPHRV